MNVIDMIDGNLFLKRIFPDGLKGSMYIGQFGLNVAGQFGLNIHTRQKPVFEIPKWGVYGESYDVLVIELLGSGAKNIKIENWINADFADFNFSKKGGDICISASEADWGFEAIVERLNFQRCSTYIDGRTDV